MIPRTWFSPRLLGLIVPTAFMIFGLVNMHDYGRTIDDWETFHAGFQNLDNLKRLFVLGTEPSWTFHVLKGFYFVMDTARAVFVWVFHNKLQWIDRITGYFFFHLVLSSLSTLLVFRISWMLTANRRISFFAALNLALLPQFIAHAMNNPKDLQGLFVYTFAFYGVTRFVVNQTWRNVIIGSLALGLAFANCPLGWLIIPISFLWLWATKVRSLASFPKLKYITMIGLGVAFMIVFWPATWDNPYRKLIAGAEAVSSFRFGVWEIYFGHLYYGPEMPWHYFLGNFLVFTPVTHLVFALLSAATFFNKSSLTTGWKSLWILSFLWFAVPVALETQSPTHYNSLRHLMFVFPAFCLVAAIGMEIVYQRLTATAGRVARLAPALIAGLYGFIFVDMVRMHPYQGAYLNVVTNMIIPDSSEEYFSLEYFGHAYKEGAEWLALNTEENSRIFVPIFRGVPKAYLNKKIEDGSLEEFEDRTTPAYLMFITRVSRYDDFIEEVMEKYEPVFEIKRQKGTLLKIYRNGENNVRLPAD